MHNHWDDVSLTLPHATCQYQHRKQPNAEEDQQVDDNQGKELRHPNKLRICRGIKVNIKTSSTLRWAVSFVFTKAVLCNPNPNDHENRT